MFILRFLAGIVTGIITRIIVIGVVALILYYVLRNAECDFLPF